VPFAFFAAILLFGCGFAARRLRGEHAFSRAFKLGRKGCCNLIAFSVECRA